MSDSFDEPAFWLPTQILDDDDLPAMDLNANTSSKAQKNGGFGLGFDADGSKALFPFEFPYGGYGAFGASSDLSSPVESVVESSETESDEEDYLAGLTLQMARSTLEGGFKHSDSGFRSENPEVLAKSWVVSGSPQSTLCAVGSGCGCGQGSSRGSPNAQSPPATWALLHAAAGEVAKMRINQSRGLLGPPRKPSPASVPLHTNPNNNNPDVGYYLHQQSLSHKHFQATHFQRLRQQQMMKEQGSGVWGAQSRYQQQQTQALTAHQMVQNRVRNNTPNTVNTRPLGLSTGTWPSLQQAQQQQQYQKNGSGLRAFFLGNENPGAKKECAGTGVFLPRQIGTQSETRKKPGCSTVLLPARVVQALNLNIDDMCAQQLQHPQPQLQRRFNGRYNPDYEVALRLRSNNAAAAPAPALSHQRKRSVRPQPPVNNEIRLPQEWTY